MRDNLAARGAALDVSGPRPHERHAAAAFVERAFSIAQRRIDRRRLVAGPLAPVFHERIVLRALLGLAVLGHVAVRVAAVVGVEDNDRVVRDAEPVEFIEHAAEAFVHAAQHRRHDGIPLHTARIVFLREELRVFLLVPPRAVHAVVPEIEEERAVLVVLDELHGLVRETVHDVFALRSVGDGADAVLAIWFAIGLHAVRRKIFSGRTWIRMTVKRDVKSLLLRPVRLRESEMPLPDMRRAIARIVQNFRERVFGGLHVVLALRQQHRLTWRRGVRKKLAARRLRRLMAGGARDAVTRGIFSREQRAARG